MRRLIALRALALAFAAALFLAGSAGAAEVRVMISGVKITVFSAGIAAVAKEPEAGKALIKFLASPAASAAIIKSGIEPIAPGSTN